MYQFKLVTETKETEFSCGEGRQYRREVSSLVLYVYNIWWPDELSVDFTARVELPMVTPALHTLLYVYSF